MTKSITHVKLAASQSPFFMVIFISSWYEENEQNPSRSVGGVAHTKFRDVRTDVRTE